MQILNISECVRILRSREKANIVVVYNNITTKLNATIIKVAQILQESNITYSRPANNVFTIGNSKKMIFLSEDELQVSTEKFKYRLF